MGAVKGGGGGVREVSGVLVLMLVLVRMCKGGEIGAVDVRVM